MPNKNKLGLESVLYFWRKKINILTTFGNAQILDRC